jgi:hypothetical protein
MPLRDDRDYKLELSSVAPTKPARPSDAPPSTKPHLNVHFAFACCNIYLRVYRSADGQSYRARCPKCAKAVTFQVQRGGTDARIFRVE